MADRKPVGIDGSGKVVVCDDGTIWVWRSDYGKLTDHNSQYGQGWMPGVPIPGTEAAKAKGGS